MTLKIITRDGWGAKPVTRPGHPVAMGPVSKVFIHHSDSADNGDEAAEVRLIQALHKGDGSSDIDYSWLVGRGGVVFEGRGWGAEEGGTRTGFGAQPEGSMGGVSYSICCLGSYTKEKPTNEMIDAIRELIDQGVVRGFITADVFEPGAIKGHREVRATNCPGDNVFAQLDAIRVRWEGEGMPYLFNEECRQGYAEGRNLIFDSQNPRSIVMDMLRNRISENDHKLRDNQIGRRFAAQDWLAEQAGSEALPPRGRPLPSRVATDAPLS